MCFVFTEPLMMEWILPIELLMLIWCMQLVNGKSNLTHTYISMYVYTYLSDICIL